MIKYESSTRFETLYQILKTKETIFYGEFTIMQKLFALIGFSVLLVIYVGCDNIQKVVTPHQEETLKIGFINLRAGDPAALARGGMPAPVLCRKKV